VENETFTQLKEKRKELIKNDVNQKIRQWEENNPVNCVHEDVFNSNNPKYISMKQVKADNLKAARIKCGLKPENDDIKINNKDPSLTYVYSPKHKTKKDLKDEIHAENMGQSKKIAKMNHKDEIQRLNEREDEIFANIYSNQQRFSLTKLKEIRKKEMLDSNLKTFSKQTIGVHGHELPKFSENEQTKEFWKLKEGYNPNPKINSHALYKEQIKYWKKPEELLAIDHNEGIPSPDSLSKIKVSKEPKDNLIIKLNNINHFKDFDPNNPTPIDIDVAHKKHIYK
jgi:hypothetical protein